MPWKIISKTIGMADGGSLHALFAGLRAALGLDGQARDSGVDRAAFTAAVVALSAKLSKSDGVALQIEEDTFERLFPVESGEVANIRWLFRLAAKDVAGFEAYASEVAITLADEPELKRDIFDALLHIASADGVLHVAEDRFLSSVRELFGYSALDYKAMRARFVHDSDDPYIVIGMTREASNEELKQRYRQLAREHHPDALAGRGLARELQDIAQRKLAGINAAWDEIARERGL